MNHEQDPDKTEDNLGFLLWHTNMIWQRKLNRALSDVDLTHTQFAMLSALNSLLKNSKAITQKAIAKRTNTDTMMVSKVLRKLEKKGLVERKEHKTDTRAKCVFLTTKGIGNYQKALKIVISANQAFFCNLSDENSFRRDLQKIVQADKILKKHIK